MNSCWVECSSVTINRLHGVNDNAKCYFSHQGQLVFMNMYLKYLHLCIQLIHNVNFCFTYDECLVKKKKQFISD